MRNHRVQLVVILSVLALAQAVPALCQIPQGVAAGGYGDTLYPYVHEYDQMLVYKIGVDYCPVSKVAPSSFTWSAGSTADMILDTPPYPRSTTG